MSAAESLEVYERADPDEAVILAWEQDIFSQRGADGIALSLVHNPWALDFAGARPEMPSAPQIESAQKFFGNAMRAARVERDAARTCLRLLRRQEVSRSSLLRLAGYVWDYGQQHTIAEYLPASHEADVVDLLPSADDSKPEASTEIPGITILEKLDNKTFLALLDEVVGDLPEELKEICEQRAFSIMPVDMQRCLDRNSHGGGKQGKRSRLLDDAQRAYLRAVEICRDGDAKFLVEWHARRRTVPGSPLLFLAMVERYRKGSSIPHDANMEDLRELCLRYLKEIGKDKITENMMAALVMHFGLDEEGNTHAREIVKSLDIDEHDVTQLLGEFFPLSNGARLRIELGEDGYPSDDDVILAQAILAGIDRRNPGWRSSGKCFDDPDQLYPERPSEQEAAKAVCASCIVRTECLADALDQPEQWGVAGFMTENERSKLLKNQMGGNARYWARKVLDACIAADRKKPVQELELQASSNTTTTTS